VDVEPSNGELLENFSSYSLFITNGEGMIKNISKAIQRAILFIHSLHIFPT
jgi:hypothetical protein